MHQSPKCGLQMLLYGTLAYAQQILSGKYGKCGDVAPPSLCLLFFATCRSVLTQRFPFQHRQTGVLAADNYNYLGVQILLVSSVSPIRV